MLSRRSGGASLRGLLDEWRSLLERFAIADSQIMATYQTIAHHYLHPDRAYHNLTHVAEVLQAIAQFSQPSDRSQLQDAHANAEIDAALLFAVWFHDVIYDSKANDNEEKSAILAETVLTSLSISKTIVQTVQDLVLATKRHCANGNPLAEVLLDADLAILGQSPDRYQAYARAIRQEYAWVPDDAYGQGRGQVLQGFLQRDRLYYTAIAYQLYEQPARNNLLAELQMFN
ncbi:MAG: hypothetical protein VKJ24_01805 [Synechococcales bacterium]|nr:hypothetical protein [Synechococcales bacterium]